MYNRQQSSTKGLVLYIIFFYIIAKWWYYTHPSNVYHYRRKPTKHIPVYNFTLLPDLDRCRKTENRTPLVIATVLSLAKDFEKRQAIRKSWASPKYSQAIKHQRLVVFFVLSIPRGSSEMDKVLQEQYEYRDIIVTDLVDSYENLVQKVHVCLTFHFRFCSAVPFLLKVDDDVVVHSDRLLSSWIWDFQSHTRLYCSIHNKTSPIRDPFNKWYVSKHAWPLKYYPTYCNGPLYVLGNATSKKIAQVSQHFTPFAMEDVFYTGVVAGSLQIPIVDWTNKIMHLLEPGTTEATLCDEDGVPLTIAYYPLPSPKDMRKGFWKLSTSKCPHVQRNTF
ncbi:hypothetical protein Q1695_002593 [Nippostrongylus brasiliensis]|nr:hypothetical protein Q1695_002593 [Nippostrongylus brasiliensis]